MKGKWIFVGCIVCFLMAGCAPTTHFGVPNKSTWAPAEFGETEALIASAEKTEGAKYCPEKIAKAKELGKKAAETHWACNTNEALNLLAEARKLAKEAESCRPAAPARVTPQPAPAAPARAKQPISFHSVYFGFDKSNLTPEARAELDRAAKIMQDNPEVVLELQGNTDSLGNEAYNRALAQKRAQSVMGYMKAKGIGSHRLKTKSLGKSKPVASNATAAGRAQNRRVDLVILR